MKKKILETSVDNSVKTTGYSENENTCVNTVDKIFLASHRDISKTEHGFCASFSETEERQRLTSDYCRAKGVYMSTEVNTYGNGYWWLRSPGDKRSYDRVRVVFPNGVSDYSYYYPNSNYGSVVPALTINL